MKERGAGEWEKKEQEEEREKEAGKEGGRERLDKSDIRKETKNCSYTPLGIFRGKNKVVESRGSPSKWELQISNLQACHL